MDFTRKVRVRSEKTTEIHDLEQLYPHNVMLYYYPPTQDITLQHFEDIAVERLKVYRILEQASSKNLRYLSDEWKEAIVTELNLQKLKLYVRLLQPISNLVNSSKKELDLMARQRDYISHFILRFVYAKSEDLRRWFITREMEWFRLKFSYLTSQDIKKFLEINHMEYTPITEEQKNEVKDGLYNSTIGQSVTKIEMLDFYKVHFTEVADLVRARKCYLKNGFAYVNTYDFISIVSSKQQQYIEMGLAATLKMLPAIEHDERLFQLIKGLHTSYTGKDYTVAQSDSVPIECLDQLSKKSFPLCMRLCHETLRVKHHLKHGGRMQYGLFLKAIGVTLEDSLRFWREEFTKIMEMDKFDKAYAYNIRHNYGKEGSMVNYTPYSCLKIITTSVGHQDTNGCPYKHMETTALKSKLAACGLSAAHVNEVASFAQKGHYQLACGKYFEITMEAKLEEGINHPNHYFELSQKIMSDRQNANASTAGTPGTPTNSVKSQKATSSSSQQKKRNVGDIVVIRAKSKMQDSNYDDDLWTAAEEVESQVDQTQQMEFDEGDFDISQVDMNF